MSIIEKINSTASQLSESDLDSWIIPELLEFYKSKINYKASRAYGIQESQVAFRAFHQMAQDELRNAAHTFLFKSQHWKTGRDINPYLLTTLSRLTDRVYNDYQSIKKSNALICPLCKEEERKEFLLPEGKLWRCRHCSDRVEQLTDQLKLVRKNNSLSPAEMAILDAKSQCYQIFSLHSRKGYRCLDCKKFIPESVNTSNGISCPYEDCIFFGTINELEAMVHPMTLAQRKMSSLQSPIGDTEITIQDTFEAEIVQADVKLDILQQNQQEYNVLMQVLADQVQLIKRMNAPGTIAQKLLMYEAFKLMLERYPEEMVSYLVHQKQNADFPIQSRIFQEYAGLVENFLPFSIEKNGQKIDIVDLTDPNLSLFLGISKFSSFVRNDGTIPNNTKEIYTGSRTYKNYGPCFIGKLIDVCNEKTGESYLKNVVRYSFVSIQLDQTISPGTVVKVSHFRIPSHYEMAGMVFLQRIRKNIVDAVYFRLNKKRRIPKGKEIKS